MAENCLQKGEKTIRKLQYYSFITYVGDSKDMYKKIKSLVLENGRRDFIPPFVKALILENFLL